MASHVGLGRPLQRMRFSGHKKASSDRRVIQKVLLTDDGVLCKIQAEYNKKYRIGYPATFSSYLEQLDSRLSHFDLPLGASIDAKPCGKVDLKVPKITFMDLFVHPTSTLQISYSPSGANICALDTTIEGSHHIDALDCNKRFVLNLDIDLGSSEDIMEAKAIFELKVDVPFPLNVTPAQVIEATGNAAVDRVLASLMDTLCASIVRDHIAWVKAEREKDDDLRTGAAMVTA